MVTANGMILCAAVHSLIDTLHLTYSVLLLTKMWFNIYIASASV